MLTSVAVLLLILMALVVPGVMNVTFMAVVTMGMFLHLVSMMMWLRGH
ncbi:MAG TPA: hypothetical protein VG734_04330 [Lacunisphaera sp.]|nr:hypothetical protein [Lacunisphaera sp.]